MKVDYRPEVGSRSNESSDASEDENGYVSRKKRKVIEVPVTAIRPPPLAFPKSLYHGHESTTPRFSERDILRAIKVGADAELILFASS